MSRKPGRMGAHLWTAARTAFCGPQILVFVPALALGGYWFGGEGLLLFVAVVGPAIVGLVSLVAPSGPAEQRHARNTDSVTGLALRPALVTALDDAFRTSEHSGTRTSCVMLEIDDFASLCGNYGRETADKVQAEIARRIRDTMRDDDVVCRLEDGVYAVALAPIRRVDLETMIQMSARLQQSVGAPIAIDGLRLFLSACVGFCLPRIPEERTGAACLEAAEAALRDAQATGAGAIRAFSARAGRPREVKRTGLAEEIADALENGEILPWFQPQTSTDTGEVSGMEALARWVHPERGVILPGVFLPAISASGLSNRLGEVILAQSLAALKEWDAAGWPVPCIAVNFGHEALADPALADRLRWELDRFELPPERLTVEILETVISQSHNDTITRNAAQLRDLGCGIDLDDFGTGHASIASIRRFNVGRIKIDRSFVTRIDTDREQQAMLTAILEMADRLGIETLAEGVETSGEHALLAQLGCGYVQGFSIARPMCLADTFDWMDQHTRKLGEPLQISRDVG